MRFTCNCYSSDFDEEMLVVNSFLKTSKVIDNKVYLAPGMVYIAPNQILLNVEGEFLPIENLSTDQGGVFVTVEEIVRAAKKKDETWKCRYCGRINEIEDRWCRTCKRDPNGNLYP